jgi:diguanylate cyclase (GGDEF)-like protein
MRRSFDTLGNVVLSLAAGLAAFVLTLAAFLMLQSLDEQIVASLGIGLFALLVVWVASEKPNSGHARAVRALVDRLMAVGDGDLESPTPAIVHREIPALGQAVDDLFSQVRLNLENVHTMAMYDPVTTLPNRVHFKREAERMIDTPLALLFVDLDGFKEVNDQLGHAQGDKVLMMVADRLREVVKLETRPDAGEQPLLARLAGDEFTLLFPGVANEADAERIARRASVALAQAYDGMHQRISIGASIGVALAPAHASDLTGLLKAADIAMYHAKRSGRSQVCVYRAELAAAFENRAMQESGSLGWSADRALSWPPGRISRIA